MAANLSGSVRHVKFFLCGYNNAAIDPDRPRFNTMSKRPKPKPQSRTARQLKKIAIWVGALSFAAAFIYVVSENSGVPYDERAIAVVDFSSLDSKAKKGRAPGRQSRAVHLHLRLAAGPVRRHRQQLPDPHREHRQDQDDGPPGDAIAEGRKAGRPEGEALQLVTIHSIVTACQ